MASGKSLELRYNAPQRTYENLTGKRKPGIFGDHRSVQLRNPERVERKARQLAVRRAAKARKQAQERR